MKTIIEREDGTRRVSISFPADEEKSVSRTKPEFYKESQIKRIIAKYRKTGILGDPLRRASLRYGDFTKGADFADAMMRVTQAHQDFMALPADLRARFGNDPGELLNFLEDPANADEAIKLGLKAKPAVVPPVVPPVEPAAPVVPPAGGTA